MLNSNDLALGSRYAMQNLDKIYCLSMRGQNNPHKSYKEREWINLLN